MNSLPYAPAPAVTAAASPLTLRAWRDYDAHTLDVPDMYLGEVEVSGPPASAVDRLWELGARRVEIPGRIDLADPADAARTVYLLSLIRDLTAQAVFTQWRLTLPAAGEPEWTLFSHLQPPAVLVGLPDGEEVLKRWRDGHFVGKCLWRRGPGFFQLRDRRWGDLRRFTVTDDAYLRAIDTLVPGATADAVPAPVLAAFEAERLVHRIGDWVCWLPYSNRRWAQSAMLI
ncbi:DUF5825 family protein [Streptomyces sp. NBC_01803]|uniref:DUF5825 family protein n=1 Tax=Streptomyces sp. NBC_01803 TaxID=2975946 RepID=UPI002DD96AA4|nr:DUF5825 family protein [Streptomyces sp. NBC_01803]WSA43106.1 DUF5825 family protein [Streptomyces sp. NBC_01803]